jgi:hypothetical protein
MKNILLFMIAVSFLYSCAAGPIYVAKDQRDAIKSGYSEAQLRELSAGNEDLLRRIYSRLTISHVGVHNEGIGFTSLRDQQERKHYYLMVHLRPAEIYFNVLDTKPEQRFSHVLQEYMPKYISYVKPEDLNKEEIEGLAFGIYWPVRDFSQCNTAGGFIEYIHVYLKKNDALGVLQGRRAFTESLSGAEVMTSLDLAPAISVRPVF